MSLAADIVLKAKACGAILTTAESCTGGMVSAAITDIEGASSVFERGFVTYSNAAKIEMLGVGAEILETHGAVSEQVAREMAQGAQQRAGAQIAVSVTGIAGPGGSAFKPEGRVCFGLAQSGFATQVETVEFGARGRAAVRAAARDYALSLILVALQR